MVYSIVGNTSTGFHNTQNQSETPAGVQPSEAAVFRLSLLFWAGIIAAVYWSIVDMLLVGSVQTSGCYPLFSQTLAPQSGGSVDFAVLVQTGSPERLLRGVSPMTFSAVLYLAAVLDAYRLMRPGRMARVSFAVLFFGYALSLLGYAGFYLTGMVARVPLNTVLDGHSPLLALFRHLYRMLAVYWMASVGLIAVGWLLLLIQTLRRRTLSPHVTAWCNPLPVGTVITVPCSPFPQSPVAAALGGATFSLAQLVFFVCAAACVRRRGIGTQPG